MAAKLPKKAKNDPINHFLMKRLHTSTKGTLSPNCLFFAKFPYGFHYGHKATGQTESI